MESKHNKLLTITQTLGKPSLLIRCCKILIAEVAKKFIA